uniref:Uncharacterized protein n=1 Tax=Arundo donax TaxID=35708 RepID=A0A0A9D5N1_ARUDO
MDQASTPMCLVFTAYFSFCHQDLQRMASIFPLQCILVFLLKETTQEKCRLRMH